MWLIGAGFEAWSPEDLSKSHGAAVAWVTHWKCPFSNRGLKVIHLIVSCSFAFYANTTSPFLASSHLAGHWIRHFFVQHKKPQLGYWATALPCTLHFLPFSRLFGINVTLRCTSSGSFHCGLELLNCLWGFPSNLYFIRCKIQSKSSFCCLIFIFAYFAFVKNPQGNCMKPNFCSLFFCLYGS